jgi:hypothetical protein
VLSATLHFAHVLLSGLVGGVTAKPEDITVLFQPFIHTMSPVTAKVHWIRSSFLGNHPNITINGSPANAGKKILTFLSLIIGLKTSPSPSPVPNSFISRPSVTRHLNKWSK